MWPSAVSLSWKAMNVVKDVAFERNMSGDQSVFRIMLVIFLLDERVSFCLSWISAFPNISCIVVFCCILASNSPYRVNVFLTRNLSQLTSLPTGNLSRGITFIRNGTLMLVAVFGANHIVFFDVFSPVNYSSVPFLTLAINSPCGLYAVNDSFIYVASWIVSNPVSTLTFSSNTWTSTALPNTRTVGIEKTFQTAVDGCGRLWLSITGYGIRIFDPWGRALLFSWPVSSGINGILLLDDYELFLADFANNMILHFKPNIGQCTSWMTFRWTVFFDAFCFLSCDNGVQL